MKHNKNHDNVPAETSPLMPVHFEYMDATAHSVCVAGSFNHWKPEAKILHTAGAGRWYKDTVLAPGTYEYCLIVDGRWMPDPQAPDSVPNPFGGRNSLLTVSSRGAIHLAEAEVLPFK